jgi:hypothetical protein
MRTINFPREIVEEEEFKRNYSSENQVITCKIPEGYITGEEFVKRGIENVNEFCKKNGLL